MKPLLIIGKVWPEPHSTAAGWRTLDLIEAAQGMGYSVHFACAAQPNEYCLDLSELGVVKHSILLNDSSFDEWVQSLGPQVVIFDRYMTEEQFGWRVEAVLPETLRILDTSDLHCLREARQKNVNTGAAVDLFNSTALREIASIFRSDLTLMISDAEMEILSEHFHVQPPLVAHWPFAVDPASLPSVLSYDQRRHCALIGSFMHPPNVDSVRWSIEAIWPRVRARLPDAELHIYGSYSERFQAPKDVEKQGIFLKGRAPEVLMTLERYRLNLAPLRYGAGLKGKVLHGLQCGTPVVGTPIAFEGIASSDNYEGHVEKDPDKIAERVVSILQSESVFERMQQQGFKILRDRFNQPRVFERFEELISKAVQNRELNRKTNFVGEMLRHHQHRSTEFMSRWIEEKNKR